MDDMSFKIELGSKVKDKVTGFTGIVVARSEWLYGCRRYTVQADKLSDGKPGDGQGFDEDALQVLKAAEPHKVKDTGGPQPTPSRARDVRR
jgi:hypothetical protein